MDSKRFSGKNITIMVVAVCIAVACAPAAVYAATGSFVNITDPINGTKARVTGQGSLFASPKDAVSGYNGKIDSLGRQQVAGTVNTVASGGTQAVSGTINVGNFPSAGAQVVKLLDKQTLTATTFFPLPVDQYRSVRVYFTLLDPGGACRYGCDGIIDVQTENGSAVGTINTNTPSSSGVSVYDFPGVGLKFYWSPTGSSSALYPPQLTVYGSKG